LPGTERQTGTGQQIGFNNEFEGNGFTQAGIDGARQLLALFCGQRECAGQNPLSMTILAGAHGTQALFRQGSQLLDEKLYQLPFQFGAGQSGEQGAGELPGFSARLGS